MLLGFEFLCGTGEQLGGLLLGVGTFLIVGLLVGLCMSRKRGLRSLYIHIFSIIGDQLLSTLPVVQPLRL